MEILVFPDAETIARQAVRFIVEVASEAIAARGQFTIATSGGTTPWLMLRLLAQSDLEWEKVQIFQVDERVAPSGDLSRNWTHLEQNLLTRVAIPRDQSHPIPVDTPELNHAASSYAATLSAIAGVPAVLDLIHLGLGADGHTASLVPGDPVLSVTDSDVAVTAPYQGQRRVTLTFPILNRARTIMWVVAGADKRTALSQLLNGNLAIPASRVRADRATVLADGLAIGSSWAT